jgi:hypothetical protein
MSTSQALRDRDELELFEDLAPTEADAEAARGGMAIIQVGVGILLGLIVDAYTKSVGCPGCDVNATP